MPGGISARGGNQTCHSSTQDQRLGTDQWNGIFYQQDIMPNINSTTAAAGYSIGKENEYNIGVLSV